MLLLALLIAPQLSTAGVFMCVDPVTGKKSFTDRACEQEVDREEVRLDATNTSSGANNARPSGNKAWNSDRDTNRSGREYRQQERSSTADSEDRFSSPGYIGRPY
jgi:hypothetical protein